MGMRTIASPWKQTVHIFLYTTLACLILIVFTNCSQSVPEQLPVLRIGHAPHDHHAPLYIAAMNPEFFRKNGKIFLKEVTFRKEYILIKDDKQLAQVIIDSSTGGKKLIRTLDERHNDITFGGVPAMLSFIDKGSEIEILLPVMSEGAGLVVSNHLPVNNWAEFVQYINNQTEPVKIGYKTAVSNQNLIFETALKSVSISFAKNDTHNEAQVTLLNLFGPKNLIPALENGIIDGFVVNQPFVAMAEYKGVGKRIASLSDLPPAGKWKNSPCCALAGNKKYVAGHPDLIEPLLSLLLRANRFISQRPEQSAEQIAQWLDINPEVERLSLPTINYLTDYDEDWNRGIHFWVESMIEADKLNKNIKRAHEQGKLDSLIYNKQTYNRVRQNN